MNIIIDKVENDIKNIECLISNLQNILGEKWGFYGESKNNSVLFFDDKIKYLLHRKRLYNVMCMMGGSMHLKLQNNFQSHTPEIELYQILEIVNKLKKRRKKYTHVVYINLCMNDKYYVGISNSHYIPDDIDKTYENCMLSRLKSHRNNGGTTNFTWLFPVISCLGFFQGTYEDENLMTILMCKFAGKNNVRGGDWASPFITPDFLDMSIEEINKKLFSIKK